MILLFLLSPSSFWFAAFFKLQYSELLVLVTSGNFCLLLFLSNISTMPPLNSYLMFVYCCFLSYLKIRPRSRCCHRWGGGRAQSEYQVWAAEMTQTQIRSEYKEGYADFLIGLIKTHFHCQNTGQQKGLKEKVQSVREDPAAENVFNRMNKWPLAKACFSTLQPTFISESSLISVCNPITQPPPCPPS